MALSVVKGTIERALDKNLQDLVRGIRNHRNDEAKYISECLDEIKIELKQSSFASKANALLKLVYLHMLGHEVGWAMFNTVEVMSCQKFTYKRIGYLAASQCFHSGSDVLMLTTNLIRKDLCSINVYEAGVALSGLACFMTTDLAVALCSDILTLTTSPKPYIRKKAVLLLYKVFIHHPETLRVCLPRLKEKLEDPDSGVQSAAVNVICELARKNPRDYLPLAPVFFKLMTSSTNNWILIKIIKLFGSLTPFEPRLGKKLIEPLTNLIHSTSAMSLLYECINTIIAVLISISSGVPDHHAAIQLCVQKLRILIEDSDQNLKYLGLLAMTKILRYHPKSVHAHKDLIFCCLDDKDESIRLRALNLLHGMVSKENLTEIVKFLMKRLDEPSAGAHYRNELVTKIVHICSQDSYHHVTSFEWYISVLIELARTDGVREGELLAAQLMDVAIRVPSVRMFCVSQLALLLDCCASSSSLNSAATAHHPVVHEVIHAAGWICAEYAKYLTDPEKTLGSMLCSANIPGIPSNSQSVLLLNSFKLYCILVATWISYDCSSSSEDVELASLVHRVLKITAFLLDKFTRFVHSPDLEVQERAVSLHQLLSLVLKRFEGALAKVTYSSSGPLDIDKAPSPSRDTLAHFVDFEVSRTNSVESSTYSSICKLGAELASLFHGEINPVAPNAQHKVPVPDGLDLNGWINPPPAPRWIDRPSNLAPNSEAPDFCLRYDRKSSEAKRINGSIFPQLAPDVPRVTLTKEELNEMREERLKRRQGNPHYLKSHSSNAVDSSATLDENQFSLGQAHGLAFKDRYSNTRQSSDGIPLPQLARPDELAEEVRRKLSKLSAEGRMNPVHSEKSNNYLNGKKNGFSCNEISAAVSEDVSATLPGALLDPVIRTNLDTPENPCVTNLPPSTAPLMPSEFFAATVTAEQFSELIISEQFVNTQSLRIKCLAIASLPSGDPGACNSAFNQLTGILMDQLPCSLIESIGSRASCLFTKHSAGDVPLCILMKVTDQMGYIKVTVKSKDTCYTSLCLARIKDIIQRMPPVS
ncbi:unnamed protein product [Dicrocoelium dendriticum]|nr:unnamed protein product [Dicrocoelium dendriticum]CAH8585218.1 unnamed protein product [Dicrocoelium dendriticum]